MACRIVLLGGPGAGKGTQARRVSKKYGLPHISTGDIFRAHSENGTEIGKKIEDYVNNGQLVPDSLVCEIVADRLAKDDCKGGYILDGFPRSFPQAEELDRLLSERGESLDVAIDLVVSDDEMVARLSARRTCHECGKIYNLNSNPPKQEGICDEPGCNGAELTHREDDREETIRKRLKIYHATTEPVVAFYERKGLRQSIDGENQSPDDIASKIEELVSVSGVS